jgi:hypothetical protein
MRIREVPTGHQSAQGFQSVERTDNVSSKRGFALSDNGQHDHTDIIADRPLSRDSIPRQQNVQHQSQLNQGAYHGNLQPQAFEFQE